MNIYKRIRRSLGLGLALLAALAAVAALLWIRGQLQPVTKGQPLSPELGAYAVFPGSNVCYAASENRFAAVSSGGWQVFDSEGTLITAEERSMEAPACDVADAVSVFYSVGETSLQLAYPDGSIKTLDTEEAIRFADVNEKGQLAVITNRDGYKGSVTVYNRQLQPVFRWDAGSARPVCARLSPKGRLAIACLTEDGSRFLIFRTDREEPVFQREAGEERILDLAFLSEKTAAILTDSALLICDTDHGTSGAAYPEGGYPSLFDTDENLAVLVSTPERFGGGGTVTAFSGSGKVLGTLASYGEILDLSVRKNRILLLTPGELILCSRQLEEIASLSVDEGLQHISLRSDGTALAVSTKGVELYDFGR